MDVERRALTAKEAERVTAMPPDEGFLKDILGLALFAGGLFGGLVGIAAVMIERYTGLLPDMLTNGGEVILGLVSALAIAGWTVVSEWRSRKNHREWLLKRNEDLAGRDNLICEVHRVIDVMLVRDPEHGQPMYFVKTEDDRIFYVFNGQDELDEDWECQPLKLKDDDRPRAGLKIILHPKTKERLLVEFQGTPIDARTCYIIDRDPAEWPMDGQIMQGEWETLPKRYQLREVRLEKEQEG